MTGPGEGGSIRQRRQGPPRGCPRRVMTVVSPFAAPSTRADNVALATRGCIVRIIASGTNVVTVACGTASGNRRGREPVKSETVCSSAMAPATGANWEACAVGGARRVLRVRPPAHQSPNVCVRPSWSHPDGFLPARGALVPVRRRPNRCRRSEPSDATITTTRLGATTTPPATSDFWPQALRCQPVERNALARGASPA